MILHRPILILAALLALGACRAGDSRTDDADTGGSVPGDTADSKAYAGIAEDEEVRFTGTEPFWAGRVRGRSLTYSTPGNVAGDMIAVERFAGRGGLSWSGEWRGAPFRLAVSEGECSDGTSDRSYPFVATLSLVGEQRTGCAWTARRGFTGPPHEQAGDEAPPVAARELILAEWRKADSRAQCAPVGFATRIEGAARRANFSGGWAVAWDRPGLRSAFGIAGTGTSPDAADAPSHRARLAAQWPLFRELESLPQPSFAGYGVEGAGAYPADNPEGEGLNSLAYVRVAGQACDYNVWSRLGRAHLERLLDSLRLVPAG